MRRPRVEHTARGPTFRTGLFTQPCTSTVKQSMRFGLSGAGCYQQKRGAEELSVPSLKQRGGDKLQLVVLDLLNIVAIVRFRRPPVPGAVERILRVQGSRRPTRAFGHVIARCGGHERTALPSPESSRPHVPGERSRTRTQGTSRRRSRTALLRPHSRHRGPLLCRRLPTRC